MYVQFVFLFANVMCTVVSNGFQVAALFAFFSRRIFRSRLVHFPLPQIEPSEQTLHALIFLNSFPVEGKGLGLTLVK